MTATLTHARLTGGPTDHADRQRQRHEIESVARAVAGQRVTRFGSIEQDLGDWIEGIGHVLDEQDDLSEQLAETRSDARYLNRIVNKMRERAAKIRSLLELSPGEIQQEAIDLAREIEGL